MRIKNKSKRSKKIPPKKNRKKINQKSLRKFHQRKTGNNKSKKSL